VVGNSIKKLKKTALSRDCKKRAGEKSAFLQPVRGSVRVSAISLLALGVLGHGASFADDAMMAASLSSTLQNPNILEAAASKTSIEVKPSVTRVDYVAPKTPKKLLIGGAMALIFAAIGKLVGANRLMNLFANAGPVVKKAAETIANAPAAAAKKVGSVMMSPVKFLMLVGGIAMIGFTGISVLDLHWSAGIVTGIGMSMMVWVGAQKVMKNLKPIKVRARENASRRSTR